MPSTPGTLTVGHEAASLLQVGGGRVQRGRGHLRCTLRSLALYRAEEPQVPRRMHVRDALVLQRLSDQLVHLYGRVRESDSRVGGKSVRARMGRF